MHRATGQAGWLASWQAGWLAGELAGCWLASWQAGWRAGWLKPSKPMRRVTKNDPEPTKDFQNPCAGRQKKLSRAHPVFSKPIFRATKAILSPPRISNTFKNRMKFSLLFAQFWLPFGSRNRSNIAKITFLGFSNA